MTCAVLDRLLCRRVIGRSFSAHVSEHGHDGGLGVLGTKYVAGMTVGKHTKYLVGKTLSHGSYIAKVESDLAERFQIRQQSSRFGTGDEVRPQ